jgi:23S rRNA pseudouridine955/2504/2580 synthase
MNQQPQATVRYFTYSEDTPQRLDNFLFKILKGVPKTHIYKMIRQGEVKVNRKKVTHHQTLLLNDEIRVAPVRYTPKDELTQNISKQQLKIDLPILFEDESLLIINKPHGLAVHGGSGVSFGVIELLRQQRPKAPFLELIHRLDKETSGILLIAKKRSALLHLQEQIKNKQCEKRYLALTLNNTWPHGKGWFKIEKPLKKLTLNNGERYVKIADSNSEMDHQYAQYALTFAKHLKTIEYQGQIMQLLELDLKTGRTHQIRVHLASIDQAIVGDEKYGSFENNKMIKKTLSHAEKHQLTGCFFNQGYRMYLHAYFFACQHPKTGERLVIQTHDPIHML